MSSGEADVGIFLAVNTEWTGPWLDRFFVWLTHPPFQTAILAAFWLLLFFGFGRRGRVAAVTIAVVVLVADQFAAGVLKPWADRVRPCFALPDARLLLPHQARSPSFPSNHAVNSFAVATVLWSARPSLGWIGLVVAALISYSRIYVGVHYPSDVLGGALVGFSLGWAGVRARRGLLSVWRIRAGFQAKAQAESHKCRKNIRDGDSNGDQRGRLD
jgi:undecaprenyl-diphosphatase